MNTKLTASFLAVAITACASAISGGCVADRPSRNGVFNENQYLKKAFIVQSAGGTEHDDGWLLKATITDVSSPNPLANLSMFGIFPGSMAGATIVRFRLAQDKLALVNTREMVGTQSAGRTEEIVNAWPITHVDLKYRVNLDGEKTNFYEENQELDWQVRQWIKVNFAKNDMSDLAPFPTFYQQNFAKCVSTVDASVSLVPGSFKTDEEQAFLQWMVSVTAPVDVTDADCAAAYGANGEAALRLGKNNVTFRLLYSMTRAKPLSAVTYAPLEVDEHDPILRKYGPLYQINPGRDPVTAQANARVLVNRFDPKTPSDKPHVWYFDEQFPEKYKAFFLDPGGIKDGTNKLMEESGATLRVDFKNANDGLPLGQTRQFGDVRYSFIRWLSDRDFSSGFSGVEQQFADPRTGETLSTSIEIADGLITEYALRFNAYLESVGANPDFLTDNWPSPPGGAACEEGDVSGFVFDNPNDPVANSVRNKNSASPLYGKMQQYLGKPVALWGNLGPSDFILRHDDDGGDFYRAFYPLIAYSIFSDPDANSFVTREGGGGVYGPSSMWKMLRAEREYHTLAAAIDRGQAPYDDTEGADGVKNASAFINRWRELTTNHRVLDIAMKVQPLARTLDELPPVSFDNVIARDARHCVKGKDGALHWETRQEWLDNLTDSLWRSTIWHEFGHALGLDHNFMGSVDKPNYPTYTDAKGKTRIGMYSSSIMEYNGAPDDIFARFDSWPPYDAGALGWVYANDKANGPRSPTALSGQVSADGPWKDPKGFANGQERKFLYCNASHLKYTPLCAQQDLGTTPSEIVANQIAMYEWNYQWRNYRSYRKYWNNAPYVDAPTNMILGMRKWLSLWAFDWSESEIADTLRRIGVDDPSPNPSRQDYFAQLTQKFTREISTAGTMIAAFHKAVIQQSAGERPYASIYDRYYGDQQQQGIILDKLLAMQGWVGLWPTDNYDANQAGRYISSYSTFGERNFETLSEDVVASMVGTQYDVYPYFIPTAVALFAQDTHKNEFSGRVEVREWLGGWTFYRAEDFINFFKRLAVTAGVPGCTSLTNLGACPYDVTTQGNAISELVGPDKVAYIWTYVYDRNTWVLARKDRNIATYKILFNYNDDILRQKDDGTYGAYTLLKPIKYMLDSFHAYN